VETPFGRLVVWRAFPEAGASETRSGVFDPIGLGTGHGDRLKLEEVQPAGGNRMSWEAFVRGRPGIIGSAVVPVE
jgi:hypothetical protein